MNNLWNDVQQGRKTLSEAIEILLNEPIMKETKLKPFDLAKALAGEKVVTRDGKSIRIICSDKKGTYPIIGLMKGEEEEEEVYSFTLCGSYNKDLKNHSYDLFMAPVKTKYYVHVYKFNNTDIPRCTLPTKDKMFYGSSGDIFIKTIEFEIQE